MRRKAKAVNFGIIYGISSFGLSEDLRISPTEAKMFIEDYFNTYPGVKDYMNKVIAEAHEKGYVKTITNRKRIIEKVKSYFKVFGLEDRIIDFDTSSANVELAAAALNC